MIFVNKEFFNFIREKLLGNFKTVILEARERKVELSEFECVETKSGISCRFSPVGNVKKLNIDAVISKNSVLFSIDAEIERVFGVAASFIPEKTLNMTLGNGIKPDAILSNYHASPCWMYPTFHNSFETLKPESQFLLIKCGDLHYHMMPLCGDNFRCEFDSEGLHLTTGMAGMYSFHGSFLSVSVADDPFEAVRFNYEEAHAAGGITIPLKSERTLPDIFRGFGWCTWNTFYRDVTDEKIYKKLDEFKEKQIPLRWLIIDDGWHSVRDEKLISFKEDPEKFPEGLKACIERIKKDYGIKYVGLWHAHNGGYWYGVDRESELYAEQKNNLFINVSGMALPSLDVDRAAAFWDAWHSYLRSCGVDFLKIDNQSSATPYLEGSVPTASGVRASHEALEISTEKNFDGAFINCMGMDMENVLSRPHSALSRNSDDFFPNKERGFVDHLLQNVYNAIWHDQLYYCDFDMWWSRHESAIQSGVLRAISASPIYVSDAMNETDAETIFPTIEDNGDVMMCDGAAKPTLDCIYSDCRKSGKLQKIWNRSGECFAEALFNVSDGQITDTFELSQIPGVNTKTEYIAYEYFEKKFSRISVLHSIEVSLPRDGVAVYSVYPVKSDENGEFIMLGNTDKYVPIASKNKKKVYLNEIL